jgi:hypothetical protein
VTAYDERRRHQKRVGVGGAIKQKDIEVPNIENEMEDCEECTATLFFYEISGSDLSQVHMMVENLGATRVSLIKEDETAPRRAETPQIESVWATI